MSQLTAKKIAKLSKFIHAKLDMVRAKFGSSA